MAKERHATAFAEQAQRHAQRLASMDAEVHRVATTSRVEAVHSRNVIGLLEAENESLAVRAHESEAQTAALKTSLEAVRQELAHLRNQHAMTLQNRADAADHERQQLLQHIASVRATTASATESAPASNSLTDDDNDDDDDDARSAMRALEREVTTLVGLLHSGQAATDMLGAQVETQRLENHELTTRVGELTAQVRDVHVQLTNARVHRVVRGTDREAAHYNAAAPARRAGRLRPLPLVVGDGIQVQRRALAAADGAPA
jgi:hypothetical protein